MTKAEALENIRTNISTHGRHIYLVTGGPDPRFAYTIGLKEKFGAELIFAGGAFYSRVQIFDLLNRLSDILQETPDQSETDHSLGELGTFSLRKVDPTWSTKLILGATDYYKTPDIAALQVVPDAEHLTIDVPDLSQTRSESAEPTWQWLDKEWNNHIPGKTMVITDWDALRGAPILEANRWEEDHWELFSKPAQEIDKKMVRVVPFATLLGADPSLQLATELDVREGIWRDPEPFEWRLTKLKDGTHG